MIMAYEVPDDYVDVAERIREFRDKHPTGSLQQQNLQMINFAERFWVVYTAAAYRHEDDQRPGIGTAWEPVPGKTPFTRDSELQNAETAAWGRAIVAALAADTKKIASADEVRTRQQDRQQQPPRPVTGPSERAQVLARLYQASKRIEPDLTDEDRQMWLDGELNVRGLDGSRTADLAKLADYLDQLKKTGAPA